VKILLENSASHHMKDFYGKTALQIAIDNNNIEIIKIIMAYGNINTIDNNGNTVLHLAVNQKNIKIINILLENDNNELLFAENFNGETYFDLCKKDHELPSPNIKYILK
jgi:ankyrin repeat protein